MKTIPAIILAIILSFAATDALAQARGGSILDDPIVEYQAQRGLNLLYNFEFEQANRLFDQIDRRYPDHPVGPFLKALNTWWQILLDLSDDSLDETFFAEMDDVVRRSDRILRRDRRNFDAMFFKGAALGFRGRLRSNRGNWWQAARDGVRAMDYVFAVADSDPRNADFQFGRGIYDYYASVVPDRYPYARPAMVLFPRGNRERGLRLLERTARDGRFIQTEAAYFLLQIYYVFEDDREKSLHYAAFLRDKHPRNSFFHTFEGRVHARWGDWRKTREVFTDVLQRYRRGETGYNVAAAEQSLYFLGRVSMLYTEYDQALRHLRELDRLAARTDADTYFKVLGRLRQGMTLDAMGRRDDALRMYRSVLSMRDWAGAHDRARQYMERPFGSGAYLGSAN
jgi:tetratricopeptide (TPR) repeat protein